MRRESGLPLGGIGAGKVEFFEDGRFSNVTINNNWDSPIIDALARAPAAPRVLEGFPGSIGENAYRRQSVTSQEGIPGCWLAVHTPDAGTRVLKTQGRPSFDCLAQDAIDFEGRFPRATIRYRPFGSIEVRLDAFSGLELKPDADHYKSSSLPLALFAVELTNSGSEPVPVVIAFSWQNLNGLGGYPHTPVNEESGNVPVFRESKSGPGLWFDRAREIRDRRFQGDYSLRALAPSRARVEYATGWDPHGPGDDIWRLLSRGRLPRKQVGTGQGGVLSARTVVTGGARETIVFALAWNTPNLIAGLTDWRTLEDPVSAPPAPAWLGYPPRPDLGHAYANWFKDSWSVAEHGLQNWRQILDGIEDWQGPLTRSSLPARFTTALCNDLFPLYTNAWYTRDFVYSINEGPTDMFGCMGTIDQRAVANAVVAQSLPALNRSEIELFTRDQIGADDARRYDTHWDVRTGRFNLRLDRSGAILHDVGWDHLDGGRTGNENWLSAHWPDLTSVYVLQVYQHGIWTGDTDWLREMYSSVREALRFQARLDQTGNGIPDLWGPGSLTYDTKLFPYYGSAPFIATLYIAALRAARQLAIDFGDHEFATWCESAIARAGASMEAELWDPSLGHYLMWRDDFAANWEGTTRAHDLKGTACHIGQLAGSWWTLLLGLDDAVSASRTREVVRTIYERNVRPVRGCPANEAMEDGSISESWTPYALVYYSGLAVAAGLPDEGWEAVDKIYRVRYDLDGSPWDAPLEWSGDHNETAQWGRFYMSNPASWYVLQAIGGLGVDRVHGRAWLNPSWPTAWGDELDRVPFFLPGLRGTVSAKRSSRSWSVALDLSHIETPVRFRDFSVRLPASVDASRARVTASPGSLARSMRVAAEGDRLEGGPLTLEKPGEVLSIRVDW